MGYACAVALAALLAADASAPTPKLGNLNNLLAPAKPFVMSGRGVH